jgi:hypothetical protein
MTDDGGCLAATDIACIEERRDGEASTGIVLVFTVPPPGQMRADSSS